MKKLAIRLYLLLIILAGLTALGFFFFHPPTVGDAFAAFENAYQGEFRKIAVLFLAGFVGAILIFAALVLILSFLMEKWLGEWVNKIGVLSEKRKVFIILISVILLASFVAGQFSLPADYLEDPLHRLFLRVTQPVFIFIFVLSIGTLFLVLAVSGKMKIFLRPDFLWPALIFLILLGAGAILVKSRFGYKQISGPRPQFDVAGNPLLGYQVIFAAAVAGIFFLLKRFLVKRWRREDQGLWKVFDLGTVILVLLLSFFLWNSEPLQPHTFVDQPRPPNYEMYPDSDALLYDRTAQSLLAKGRFLTYLGDEKPDIGLRPGLTFYQAILHTIAGLAYRDIVPFQLLIFSFLPVLIYIFASLVHTRTTGFFAALLIMIRDFNGQVMPNIDAGVHAKLLESEIPMIMGMLLFLIIFLVWLRSERRGVLLPLLGGGILGWSMLIRLESVLLIPVAGLMALVTLWDKKTILLKSSGFLIFGVILVISPWMYRNWYYTGDIYLNRPDNRIGLLRESFQRLREEIRGEGSFIYPEEIGRSRDFRESEQTASIHKGHGPIQASALPRNMRGLSTVIHEISEEDLNISILDHLTNNLVQSVISLPSNPLFLNVDYLSKAAIGKAERYYGGLLYSPEKYVRSLPYWWNEWDGSIPPQSFLLVIVNIFLISNGIFVIFRHEKRGFWLLLMLYGVFVGLYSLIRRSGGRSLQISDWVVLVFYSAGLMNLFYRVWVCLSNHSEGLISLRSDLRLKVLDLPDHYSGYVMGCVALGLLFLGSLPPLAEVVFHDQYPETEMEKQLRYILDDRKARFPEEQRKVLKSFLDNGGEAVYGRALYPRQFFAGETTLETKSSFYGPMQRRGMSRFEFFVAGTKNVWGVLKREDTPQVFPHGVSILSIGCEMGGNLDAIVVLLLNEENEIQEIYWRDSDLDEIVGCPLPQSENSGSIDMK